jgi:predicted enzyme related to lactoylglutathione lyase
MHTGTRIYNESGALSWNELMAPDAAAARDFYSRVFGFTHADMGPQAGGWDYTTFSTGANPLGGIGATSPDADLPRGWLTCFGVADTDEAIATVEAKGGTLSLPPKDTSFGRFAIVRDPWGAAFEVMGPAKRS